MIILSEQCFIDCVRTCDGCNSGNVRDAWDWERDHQNHVTMAAADYRPYSESQGECEYTFKKGVSLLQLYLTMTDEYFTHVYITQYGTIISNIDASPASFQLYSSGMYDDQKCSQTELNHCVQIIGFGHVGNYEGDYWIVRNSFGKAWGEEGYIRIAYGYNICGIVSEAQIPLCGQR
ncbi:hypothetical protein TRFO_23408 [Tritrichomonas foetus]|uniref:Peptidase C1A papain C-terminal domain-containing protein n=1 Tax=Tritrichomonas foetus TaxID=1144522 RepID=A0A1J4KAD6_9EUKA|nr:hypothetical protein TRFO_23408 [Tritrichomonas foetus]|eukprot:OHT08187.1 hypothetical protein TRFO_23408 [Tritrichomonas foetus]